MRKEGLVHCWESFNLYTLYGSQSWGFSKPKPKQKQKNKTYQSSYILKGIKVTLHLQHCLQWPKYTTSMWAVHTVEFYWAINKSIFFRKMDGPVHLRVEPVSQTRAHTSLTVRTWGGKKEDGVKSRAVREWRGESGGGWGIREGGGLVWVWPKCIVCMYKTVMTTPLLYRTNVW